MELRPEAAGAVAAEIELNNEEIAAVKAAVAKNLVKHGPRYVSLQAFLTVCLVLALVGGTFAWYSNNRQVKDGATQLVSDPVEFAMTEFNVYKKPVQISNGAIVTDLDGKILTETAEDLGARLIDLNPYDSVFENNEYTPVYVRIKMNGNELVKPNTTIKVYLIATGPVTSPGGLYYFSEGDAMDTNISNIVSVKWASGISGGSQIIDTSDGDLDRIYAELNATTASISWSEAQSYLVPSGFGRYTTVQTGTSINSPGFATGASITDGDNGAKIKLLCIEIKPGEFEVIGADTVILLKIDYEPRLVQAYLNSRKQSNAARLGSTEVIDFTGDMTLIKVECSNPNNNNN